MSRVLLTSGGSESVESAMKLVRQHFLAKGQPLKRKIIARRGAYHGCTMGALSLTGIPLSRIPFEPQQVAMLDEVFEQRTLAEWIAVLSAQDGQWDIIRIPGEAKRDEQALANGYVQEIVHPKHGKTLKVHGTPWGFSETPARIGIAPELGADTDAILADLGYAAGEIAALRAEKVV